jgi:hypothetical protein
MPASVMHTVWYRVAGLSYKVFKVGFGGDGSYYVTTPYHPLDTAIAAKVRVNYARDQGLGIKQALEGALEIAVVDDDEHRLKLSHHPDGFLQFSGQGILSGRHPSGKPKGLGLRSWELQRPTFGPSFGVGMYRPELMGRQGKPDPADVVFDGDDLDYMRMPGHDFLDVRFAGHYFPPRFRSFVRPRGDGGYRMSIVNPESHVVHELQVVLASKESALPGVIGLSAEPMEMGIEGFSLSSSTGGLRRSSLTGDLIGDQLVCLYPRPTDLTKAHIESLNYGVLPAPAYTAPPGSPVMPAPVASGQGRTASRGKSSRRKR